VHPEAGVAHDQHLGLAAMAEGAELLQPQTSSRRVGILVSPQHMVCQRGVVQRR
jgi:hypothetical protein